MTINNHIKIAEELGISLNVWSDLRKSNKELIVYTEDGAVDIELTRGNLEIIANSELEVKENGSINKTVCLEYELGELKMNMSKIIHKHTVLLNSFNALTSVLESFVESRRQQNNKIQELSLALANLHEQHVLAVNEQNILLRQDVLTHQLDESDGEEQLSYPLLVDENIVDKKVESISHDNLKRQVPNDNEPDDNEADIFSEEFNGLRPEPIFIVDRDKVKKKRFLGISLPF